MSSDLEICEPLVKRERVDDELEMVNYEMPMQIYVPEDADDEIDPLAVENNAEPCDSVQRLGLDDFVRPIKSELELEEEFRGEIEETLPKIDSVMSNFELPRGQIEESVVIENSSLARSDDAESTSEEEQEIYVPDDSDVEEITIEPKTEKVREISRSADRDFQLTVAAKGPEVQQLNRSHQAREQRLPVLTGLLMSRQLSSASDQLLVQDPALGMSSAASPPAAINRPAGFASNEVSTAGISDRRGTQSTSAQILGNHMPTPQNHSTVQPRSAAATALPSSHQEPARDSPILEPMSVSRLLGNPFSSGTWTKDQKNAIIKLSRPTPEIDTLRRTSAEYFYNLIPWLCGSSSLRKFFCWPCLLFFYSPTYTDLLWSVLATFAQQQRTFRLMWQAHEASYAHQAAEKALANWLQNLNSSSKPNQTQRVRNISTVERVRKNRKLLSLLVQSVCYLRKENHNASVNDYAECFDYVLPSNSELQDALIEFQGSSSKGSSWDFVFKYAQPIECVIEKVMNSKKSDELKNTRFVTLFMEDFSSIVDDSNVVVIAHFVDQSGDIQERIVEIIEIGRDRSANEVFLAFQRILCEFGLRLKVAGFTYSATLVHPSDITAFNERVERLCPTAKFFHYQGHNLTGMLFGALSHLNRTCKNFFHTITELQEFFKKHLVQMFLHFEQLKSSHSEVLHDFEYGFITTLKQSYSSVLETFGSILTRPDEWDVSVSSQAPIFMRFLQDNTTRFLIVLISQLNLAIMDVSSALQGKIDAAKWKLLIRRAVANFITIKNFGLEDVYVASLNPALAREHLQPTPDVSSDLVTVFNEIIDTAISFLHQRFDTVDFGYVDLESVAMRYYTRLRLSADDIHRFRLQIQLLAKEPTLKGKSLAEILKHFCSYNLAAAVPEYATFLNFSMTIPSSRSCMKCPAVDRILNHRNRSNKPISSKKSIWMEKELLVDILKNKKLCETVIDTLLPTEG